MTWHDNDTDTDVPAVSMRKTVPHATKNEKMYVVIPRTLNRTTHYNPSRNTHHPKPKHTTRRAEEMALYLAPCQTMWEGWL